MEKQKIPEQTEKQSLSKSPLYGYRKPVTDESGTWCNCTQPNLVSNRGVGGGSAYCLRCGNNYYH